MISDFSRELFRIMTTRSEFTKAAGAAGPPPPDVYETDLASLEKMRPTDRGSARHPGLPGADVRGTGGSKRRGRRSNVYVPNAAGRRELADRAFQKRLHSKEPPLTPQQQKLMADRLTKELKTDADTKEKKLQDKLDEKKAKDARSIPRKYWEDRSTANKVFDALSVGSLLFGGAGLLGLGTRLGTGAARHIAGTATKRTLGETFKNALRTKTRDQVKAIVKKKTLNPRRIVKNRTAWEGTRRAGAYAAGGGLAGTHLESAHAPGTIPDLKIPGTDTVIRQKSSPPESVEGTKKNEVLRQKGDLRRQLRNIPMVSPKPVKYQPPVQPKQIKTGPKVDPRKATPPPPPPGGASIGTFGGGRFGAYAPPGRAAFSYKNPQTGQTGYKYWNTRGAAPAMDRLTGTKTTPTTQQGLLRQFRKRYPKVDMSTVKWTNKTPTAPQQAKPKLLPPPKNVLAPNTKKVKLTPPRLPQAQQVAPLKPTAGA